MSVCDVCGFEISKAGFCVRCRAKETIKRRLEKKQEKTMICSVCGKGVEPGQENFDFKKGKCKYHEEIESKDEAEGVKDDENKDPKESEGLKADDPICKMCNRPASALTSYFNLKQGAHGSCIQVAQKKAQRAEAKKTPGKPAKKTRKKTEHKPDSTVDPIIKVDFTNFPELFKRIQDSAINDLRTLGNQTLYILKELDWDETPPVADD